MPSIVAWSLLSPANLLWFVGAFVALTLLFGSMNMQRTKLTETLRRYVTRKQAPDRTDRSDAGSED